MPKSPPPAPNPTPGTRRPGRPRAQRDSNVRQRLLIVATELVANEGLAQVSARRIAEQAQVNPAMVHYYFGNRDGLLEAMLEHALAPLFSALAEWEQETARGTPSIGGLIQAFLNVIAANHWLPALIVREVLGRAGPFRQRFVEQFAARGRSLVVKLISDMQQRGELRANADPALSALSLLSMIMFPFIALPVSSRLYGVNLEDDFLQRQAIHIEQLFLHGLKS